MGTDAERKPEWILKIADPPAVLPWTAGAAAVSFPCFYFFGELPVWTGFLFLFLLLFPALEDALTGYISDGWSFFIGISGGMYCFWLGNWRELWGTAAVFGILLVLYLWRRDAMGEGDVWLAAAISLWLPGWDALLFLWLSFFFGSAAGILFLLLGRKKFADGLPFAPFLCLAGYVVFLFGERLAEWYASFF